jgi:hypothetical protein
MGGAALGGAALGGAAAPLLPPPLKGGDCSTGRYSFLSGVITAVMMFLSS